MNKSKCTIKSVNYKIVNGEIVFKNRKEISFCTSHIQLIFERKVGGEEVKDTCINKLNDLDF